MPENDKTLIEEYIERAGSQTKAALLLGTSRRSLARWLEGVHPLPDDIREKLDSDIPEMINERIEIPAVVEARPNLVLYVQADLAVAPEGYGEDDGFVEEGYERPISTLENTFGSKTPLVTVAQSIEHNTNGLVYVHAVDGQLLILDPRNTAKLTAEYVSENDPRIIQARQSWTTLPENTVMAVPPDYRISYFTKEPEDMVELKHGRFDEFEPHEVLFTAVSSDLAQALRDLPAERAPVPEI